MRHRVTLRRFLRISLLVILLIRCSDNEVVPIPNPVLTSISPTSGPKLTVVTINGNDFGTDISSVKVFFNNIEAEVQSVDNEKIMAIVPRKAFTGSVKVELNGSTLEGPVFTYEISEVTITTIAGSEQGYADGPGDIAQFDRPAGIAIDSEENIYISDFGNRRVRKITPDRGVSTLAEMFPFDGPLGVVLDSENNVYVSDANFHEILIITPDGMITNFAGSEQGFADGPGDIAQFDRPAGLALDSEDNVYVADADNHKIRKITPDGMVTTLAGGEQGFADGPADIAQFDFPMGIALDPDNNIYVADANNHRIRKITPDGMVITLAGSSYGFADGPAVESLFRGPTGIAIDLEGYIYIADFGNHRIRKLTPDGMVNTLAGSDPGFADGPAAEALFRFPRELVIDAQRDLYVSDFINHKIRKITQE